MGSLMDLIAGDTRQILLAVGLDEPDRFADSTHFAAHLALGRGLDPTWLDLFSEAARTVTDGDEPLDFIDARTELAGPGEVGDPTIERVDRRWIEAIARLDDDAIGPVAGRWMDLIDDAYGELPREEKPWIRQLAGEIVRFCRNAGRAGDVLFVWSL
jgi:hypothetical protein